MIAPDLPLGVAVEVHRVDVRGKLRASLRGTADDATTGVVEVRRAYGPGGPVVPYSPAKTLTLNGSTELDLTVDDCPELAIVVTTPGAGIFELESFTDQPALDSLDSLEVELDRDPTLWSQPIQADHGIKVTLVSDLDGTPASATAEIRAAVDPQGKATAIAGGSVALDGTVTTIEVDARGRVDLVRATGEAIAGKMVIYCSHKLS